MDTIIHIRRVGRYMEREHVRRSKRGDIEI